MEEKKIQEFDTIEEVIETTGKQVEIKDGKARSLEALKPYQYKKGQSGNPSGRPKGISLKEYAKLKFVTMNDDEKEDFLHGLSKDIIWEMGEGRADSKTEMTGDMTINLAPEDKEKIKNALRNRTTNN